MRLTRGECSRLQRLVRAVMDGRALALQVLLAVPRRLRHAAAPLHLPVCRPGPSTSLRFLAHVPAYLVLELGE